MKPSDVTVLVQRVEGRPIWERTKQAIEATDIGTRYLEMVHPPGMPVDEFFLSTLERLSQAEAELVIRFEDDAVYLNDHILHNVATWDKIHDPRFGAGWLLAINGCTANLVERYIYKQYGQDTWRSEPTQCTSACLFWRRDLPELIEGCKEWFAQHGPGYGRCFDWALCHAVLRQGKQICVHAPSLVDHDPTIDSTLGHGMTGHLSDGTFRKDWKR